MKSSIFILTLSVTAAALALQPQPETGAPVERPAQLEPGEHQYVRVYDMRPTMQASVDACSIKFDKAFTLSTQRAYTEYPEGVWAKVDTKEGVVHLNYAAWLSEIDTAKAKAQIEEVCG